MGWQKVKSGNNNSSIRRNSQLLLWTIFTGLCEGCTVPTVSLSLPTWIQQINIISEHCQLTHSANRYNYFVGKVGEKEVYYCRNLTKGEGKTRERETLQKEEEVHWEGLNQEAHWKERDKIKEVFTRKRRGTHLGTSGTLGRGSKPESTGTFGRVVQHSKKSSLGRRGYTVERLGKLGGEVHWEKR